MKVAPKALVFSVVADPESIRYQDAKSVAIGLQRAGYAVDFRILKELVDEVDELPIESYKLICYQAPGNALHVSSAKNYKLFTELHSRARDGAITIFLCDITYPLDPNIWDPEQGRAKTKLNLMAERPVRFIGSFSEDILEDPKAMELIERKFLSKVHPDSSFIPIEWLTFHHELMVERRGGDPKNLIDRYADLEPLEDHGKIKRFYYGVDKKKLVESLRSMGLGDSKKDAVFGSVAKLFPDVRDLRSSPRRVGREYWLPYARQAKSVLVPYEPIKGDYQATLRLLEALEFYPETAVVDERMAEWMKPMVSSSKAWKKRMARAVDRMVKLHKK